MKKKVNPDFVYENFYDQLLNSGAVGKVSNWTHKSLERTRRGVAPHFPVVLEIGAGQGQHLKFVKHSFNLYYETDIRLEVLEKATSSRYSPDGKTIIQMAINAEDLSFFPNNSVDRIVISCVLAHLSNPRVAMMELSRILRPGGEIAIYLASEPGFILRSLRWLSTVQKARKMGLDHLRFNYLEHRNHFLFLKYLIQEVFEKDVVRFRSYPIPGMSWNFSLWKTVTVIRAKDTPT